MQIVCKAPAVVCCRCSPTQKAAVVRLIKKYTKARVCAIGDGGNDVSMIQVSYYQCLVWRNTCASRTSWLLD